MTSSVASRERPLWPRRRATPECGDREKSVGERAMLRCARQMSAKSRLNIFMRVRISYRKWALVWGALEMLRMNILSVAPFGFGVKRTNRRWHILGGVSGFYATFFVLLRYLYSGFYATFIRAFTLRFLCFYATPARA